MGEKWVTRQNWRREMGVYEKQDKTQNIICQRKMRKTGKKTQKNRRNFGKCWKRKQEQKQGLLEWHKITIGEQMWGLGAGLLCTEDDCVYSHSARNSAQLLQCKLFDRQCVARALLQTLLDTNSSLIHGLPPEFFTNSALWAELV